MANHSLRWEDIGCELDHEDFVSLEQAMMAQNVEQFNNLLDSRPEILQGNIIHAAVREAKTDIAEILLTRGLRDEIDFGGKTPLMCAVEGNSPAHTGLAMTLLAAGALVDVRDDDSVSAIDIAASTANVPVLQTIAARVTNIDSRDKEGQTALHHAARGESVEVIDTLIEAGASTEVANNAGVTPLLTATYAGSVEIMLALLRHGANVKATVDEGRRPLHMVCLFKNTGMYDAADALLRFGADETALDDEGQTPESLLEHDIGPLASAMDDDEIEGTRLLLSRAPADRAWRRRGWLAILRTRLEIAGEPGDSAGDGGSSEVESGRAEESGSNADKKDSAGGDCAVLPGKGFVAGRLLKAPEGVFRSVVGFL